MTASPAPEPDHRSRLERMGTKAWMLVGIVVLAAIGYSAAAALSGLVAPLVVAVVIGMLFVPLVDRLTTLMPRSLAAAVVLVGLVLAGVAVAVITIDGLVAQSRQIGDQLNAGWLQLQDALVDLGFDPAELSGLPESAGGLTSGLLQGLAGTIGSAFSSVTALLTGVLVGAFLLYFVLKDWAQLSSWVGTHLGVPGDMGMGIVDDATFLTRQYFIALTLSSLVTAAVIGIAAALLGVPLAVTIAVVTFATSYVPYLGAIFSGAFAALIALGAGGTTDALVLLVVILVAQNVVQTIMQTMLTESRLTLHPVVIFGSTIVGAALAGIIGATLSAPAVALVIRIVERVDAASDDAGAGPSAGPDDDLPVGST
jgi:predicted PurR-regulated permease PerM